MKKYIYILLAFIVTSALFGQSPNRLNYQILVKDANSRAVTAQNVGLKISVLHGSENGNVVYSETQLVTTDIVGVANFRIGDGEVQSGNFSQIIWADGPYFVRVEMDVNGGGIIL